MNWGVWKTIKDPYRWQELADYNAMKSRGLVHTHEYQARMAEQQAQFDAECGLIPIQPGD